jgi:hypothetical protein
MESDNQPTAPKALVLATADWPLAAFLALGLWRNGFAVEGLCPRRHALRNTAAVEHCFLFSSASPVRSLLRAIRRSAPTVLVPTDDRSVYVIYDLHARCLRGGISDSPEIIRLIERSLGKPEAFSIARSKAALIRLARANGIRIPETREINSVDELIAHCDSKTPPFVLKQDGTYGGLGVIVAPSKDEAVRAFHRLRVRAKINAGRDLLFKGNARPLLAMLTSPPSTISVQQHIEGRPANRAVLCWQGRVLAGTSVMTLEADPFPNGPATVVEFIRDPEIDNAVETLVSSLGLSGFCGFDFILDGQTARSYLLELNPRATSAAWLGTKPRSDLSAALFRAVVAETCSAVAMPSGDGDELEGEKAALFPQEWLRSEKSAYLAAAYHRVPWQDRQLLRYLIASAPVRRRGPKLGAFQRLVRRLVLGKNWRLSADPNRSASAKGPESGATE